MKTTLIASVICIVLIVFAKHNGLSQSGCARSTSQADLDINNVRTTILVSSDMWWDLVNPKYEIPKGSGKHSLYAGALWIGGIDEGGQIKVAAQTYRQTGTDWWGGALDTSYATITFNNCLKYDKHWKVTKKEVIDFRTDPALVSNDIKSWPGNGNPEYNEGHFLAPFVDINADGIYNYADGDYPGYNFTGVYPDAGPEINKPICNDYLFGDQTIWWVFNDKGNIHSETGSQQIGLEVRAQAFAFQTNDEINNMTFYKYQIINRSTQTLTDTYFGQWVDPDLGNSLDDYVGCDVRRGLGFCYNGDADDETASGYGINPPAVGVDFFQGPAADNGDLIDNDKDGCIDCTYITNENGITISVPDYELSELIIMSKFVKYDNVNGTMNGNPDGYLDFYSYLKGYWLNSQVITFGGDGTNTTNPPTNYMFPGDTDPAFPGQNWSEVTVNNPVADRRFLQSAGTFTLEPGAVNYITTGVVWARASEGGPLASVELMKQADDKAQALFNNCFKLIDGPDAPDLAIRELDKRIIFSILNADTSSIELYHEKDPTITGVDDSLTYFDFQGYQIFQLKDATVSSTDLSNPDKARLVFQSDIKDNIGQIVNYTFEPSLNANIPSEMVNGNNQGIVHTFEILKDMFASGSTSLVNHKTYYYMIISYAHNSYEFYNPTDPGSLDGQKKPYLAGRNNVKTYSAIPHIPSPEFNGLILNSSYGEGLVVTRLEGSGNGGMILDFTPKTIEAILTAPSYRAEKAEYLPFHSPITAKIYDPVLVKNTDYEYRFDGTELTSNYTVTELKNQKTIESVYSIGKPDEQVFPEWGISTLISTATEPGDSLDPANGFLEGTMTFSNAGAQWLSAVRDVDDPTYNPADWIRSGNADDDPYAGLDDFEVYEKVIDGTWAPYKLCSKQPVGPKWSSLGEPLITISPTATTKTQLSGVDIVLTADKSKWTRAAVIETGWQSSSTIGNAKQYSLRKSPSIGKNGEPDFSISPTGMSWFPGYAYNLETGERLNIAFGENSELINDHAVDMKFNPTSRMLDNMGNPVFGGMHYIYVFGHNGDDVDDVPAYDSCRFIAEKLTGAISNEMRKAWKDAMWCNIPLVEPNFAHLQLPDEIPSDVKVRLRVVKKFRPYAPLETINNTASLTVNTTYYVSSVPVIHNGITYSNIGESFVAVNNSFSGEGTITATQPSNNFNPLYRFSTAGYQPVQNDYSNASAALNLINVVPNPYYSHSGYEINQLDNRIKIVNLPPKCEISIFTQNGTLVRRIKRDVPSDNTPGTVVNPKSINTETSVDWDLKNMKGIPVASGIYLIHINAGSLGEKTIKWFGMLRPIDLDTF
jgi:hypothetical protein